MLSQNAFPLTGSKLEPENAATKKALEDSIAGRANSAGRPSSGGMGSGGGAGEKLTLSVCRDWLKGDKNSEVVGAGRPREKRFGED